MCGCETWFFFILRQKRRLRVLENSGVPRNFFRVGGVSTNSVEDRENGDLGVVAP